MVGLETCTRILITGTHLDIIVESYEKLLRVHMENSIEIQRPTCGKISNSILHIEDWPSGYGQPSRLHHGERTRRVIRDHVFLTVRDILPGIVLYTIVPCHGGKSV